MGKDNAGIPAIDQTKQTQMTFERVPRQYYPEWGFRPQTLCVPMEMNFIFLNGGMGDYLCWIPAIRWLAAEATWIKGNVVVPTYFTEVIEYFLKPFPNWNFCTYKTLEQLPKVNDMPFRGPVELNRESLNATGAHLLTCGWVYFTNKEKAPEGWDTYAQFAQTDLEAVALPEEAASLKAQKYAVITTGQTTNSRKVPPGAWNHIIDYVVARGLMPVFLGKSEMDTGNAQNIHTKFDSELRFNAGVDLRDKTSIMQAASVMSRAAVVIGHDNGLLHLAGMTDAPIVFGYNIASPEHREPRRTIGRVYNVCLTDAELACNFCQSKNNFLIGYNFRECFYGDRRCMDLLFADSGARWKTQIDRALGDK